MVETARLSPYNTTTEVNAVAHSEHTIPTDGSEAATEQREHLDFVPDKFKTSPNDSYHGHSGPSKAKGGKKPSGKKPLWSSNKKHN